MFRQIYLNPHESCGYFLTGNNSILSFFGYCQSLFQDRYVFAVNHLSPEREVCGDADLSVGAQASGSERMYLGVGEAFCC
jgi:hypothetical protein